MAWTLQANFPWGRSTVSTACHQLLVVTTSKMQQIGAGCNKCNNKQNCVEGRHYLYVVTQFKATKTGIFIINISLVNVLPSKQKSNNFVHKPAAEGIRT